MRPAEGDKESLQSKETHEERRGTRRSLQLHEHADVGGSVRFISAGAAANAGTVKEVAVAPREGGRRGGFWENSAVDAESTQKKNSGVSASFSPSANESVWWKNTTQSWFLLNSPPADPRYHGYTEKAVRRLIGDCCSKK